MSEIVKYNFLIKQYSSNVYGYALYMMKNRMDADDVTQEVFIRIWKNIDRFNVLAAKPWILKTTHNLCIDHLRKRSKAENREIEFEDALEPFPPVEENQTLKIHYKMVGERIKEAIKKLPENLRSVFVLYEINGLKYREISKTLEIPVNSVKVYLMRARKRLQEELKQIKNQEAMP